MLGNSGDLFCGMYATSHKRPFVSFVLFFPLYINDLENVLQDCRLKLYADDTVLYQSGDNCDEAEGRLQAA